MRHSTEVHLDHTDDRTGYLGLSHASCNLSTTGRLDNVQHDKVCDHCGLTYQTRYLTQRYCSNACRKAAPRPRRVKALKARLVAWHDRSCGTCAAPFATRQAIRLYCSNACAQAKGLTCATCASPIKRSRSARPQGEAICHRCRAVTPQRKRVAA